ncbi:5'/3'-nucleotidase SurE [Orbus sturtevantii]|uniref:5'/3'-nucleotidase SurE n=1 Tax=Orbus sturtevantii TaxID=3074109 RepID=UPI00370D81C0
MNNKLLNRVLLLNDDGIDAPGMLLLKNIARSIANEVWVVAPAIDQSGVSCAVSLKAPFRAVQRSEHEYAIYGTPADCASFAIRYLMRDNLPDLVLSGINNGSNLGFETVLSGTVGGAMMAMVMGIRSIAFSQVTKEGSGIINWDVSEYYAKSVIEKLLNINWPSHICMNVNFPNCEPQQVQGIRLTTQGDAEVDGLTITAVKDPENNNYFWFRAKHSDSISTPNRELDATNLNYIAVTPLAYGRTDGLVYTQLQNEFN